MRRRCTSAALLCALVAVLGFAPALAAQGDAAAADRAEVQKKFDEALKSLREGKYDAASAALDEVLKLNPTSHEALVLREKAGVATLADMLRKDEGLYRKFALEIMRRAEGESQRVERSPATVAKYLGLLASEDVVTREDAIFRLAAVGSVAVPGLLDTMLSGDRLVVGARKAGALRALRMMGPTAIPPILAAIRNADADTAANLIPFLTEIPDARSVPVLCSILDDPARPAYMKKVAGDALNDLMPPPPPPPPPAPGQPAAATPPPPARPSGATACYRLATRYYYDDPVLTEILPSWERLIWSWTGGGKTLAECLKAEPNLADGKAKPLSAQEYSQKLCRALLIDGMQLPHEQPDLIELYISNNFRETIEGAKADAAKAAADRRTNESFGARYLYLSLGRALRDRNVKLAILCIASLRNIGDPRLPTEENTLVAALDYPDKDVRAPAAEALMEIYPGGDLAAADRVIAATSAALGAQMRPTALVLTTDEKFLADIRPVATSAGLRVETRKEQVDALVRLREVGLPVSVFVVDARLKGIGATAVVDNIRRDAALANLPVFIFTPKEDAAKLAAEAKGKVAGVCAIPVDATEAAQSLSASAKSPATPAVYDITNNVKMLTTMLTTLKDLPAGTRYPVRDLTPAVVRLTAGFPAEIRRLAFQVLAAHPDASARDAAYEVFVSGKEPTEVRREAGTALLRILPLRSGVAEDQVAAFRKTTADPDAEVAALANRMLAVAAIPQTQREAALLAIVAPESAAAKPAAVTTTTVKSAGTTAKPGATTTTTKASAGTPPATKAPAPKTPASTAKPAGK